MLKLRQAILTVVACIACFGLAGAGSGWLLGQAAPSFVTWLMGHEANRSPGLDPSEFSLGIGLMGGAGFGAFLGIILIVLLVLRDAWVVIWTRTPPDDARVHAPPPLPSKPPREPGLD